MARVISVSHDGTGDYRTLQEAIDTVPFSNTRRTVIRLSPGIYKQPVYVPKTKNLITLAGFSPELTVITWNNTANKIDHHQPSRLIGTGTFGCGSAIVEGEDFIAENITFENSAPEGSGQAVAIRVTADRCAFYNCRFLGWQDTLYLHYGKQYLKDCYIEGSVDFIFGNSTALLEHCHIHCKSAGFITAQSRKSSQEATGYVFLRCVITGNGGTAYSYLGRPWGPFGRVVFAHTYMDACIKHHGWHNWGKTENERSACFYEYRCFGPGSCLDKRVTWARELVDEEAGQFLMHSFIDPNPERPWLAQRMALRDPIPKNAHTPQKISKPDKWETKEDMVLMSAWIFVSEEPARGKNQKTPTFWSRVKERYDATRAENEEGLGIRNENQMKGRFARLNESANKWVVAYRKAYHQKNSGMSMKDLEKEAHAIYEMGGSKFNDLFVFNEVMCKHPKWDLQLQHDTTHSCVKYEAGDEESGGSTKRSRTTEGDYSVETNQESPTVGGSTVQRFMGKDAAKIKGKVKASQASSIPDYSEEFHALNITRNSEVEILTKRLEFEKEKEHHKTLRILLAKEPLSPGEEELKERLLAMLYG